MSLKALPIFIVLGVFRLVDAAGAAEYAVFEIYLFQASHADTVVGYPIFPGEVAVQVLDEILKSADEYERSLRSVYQFSSYALLGTTQMATPIDSGDTGLQWSALGDRYVVGVRPLPQSSSELIRFSVRLRRKARLVGAPRPGLESVISGSRGRQEGTSLISTQLFAQTGGSVVIGRLLDGRGPAAKAVFLVVAPALYRAEEMARLRSAARKADIADDRLPDERLLLLWHGLQAEQQGSLAKAMQSLRARLESRPSSQPTVFTEFDTPPQPKGGFTAIQGLLRYPEAARKEGIEGRGIYHVLIDSEGRVQEINVLKSAGTPELDQAAQEAVRSVEWQPALLAGKPVAVRVALPVIFRLDQQKSERK